MTGTADAPVRPRREPHRRWRRTVVVAIIQLLGALVALEVGARIYWRMVYDVPFTRPSEVLYVYYPELAQLPDEPVSDHDAVFDIALFGASVLHPNFGDVSARIGTLAARAGVRPVRVFNLAMPAQTSLDSRYKRLEARDHRFDLVIVYHGINDVRANACPPELFRADYSHWSWYRHIASYRRHRDDLLWTALPFTLQSAWLDLEIAVDPSRIVPRERPPREWFHFAEDVRTAAPFRDNLDVVVAHSGKVLLVTLASYIAPGYTEERFESGSLDYGRHTSPIELWGDPVHVAAAIDVHNRITREVAAARPNARLLDLAATMPRSAATFDDICHLTKRGCEIFAEATMPSVLAAMRSPPAAPPTAGR